MNPPSLLEVKKPGPLGLHMNTCPVLVCGTPDGNIGATGLSNLSGQESADIVSYTDPMMKLPCPAPGNPGVIAL
jgi:hypothetical protein